MIINFYSSLRTTERTNIPTSHDLGGQLGEVMTHDDQGIKGVHINARISHVSVVRERIEEVPFCRPNCFVFEEVAQTGASPRDTLDIQRRVETKPFQR
jgi:hypothetical protein